MRTALINAIVAVFLLTCVAMTALMIYDHPMPKKTEDSAAEMPPRYKISEGQVANPNYGKPGHADEFKPAIPSSKKSEEPEE